MFVPRLDSVYPSHHQKFLLFPESNRKQSIWPIEYWILLRDGLVAKGFVVEFCGSEKLAMQVPSVITPSDTKALIATIKQYDSVICAEGGASHLAAICQKQVTVISGAAIKDTWFPWSLDVALIERSGGVETIAVDEVLQVALRQGEFNRLSISFDENLPEKMNAYLNQEAV